MAASVLSTMRGLDVYIISASSIDTRLSPCTEPISREGSASIGVISAVIVSLISLPFVMPFFSAAIVELIRAKPSVPIPLELFKIFYCSIFANRFMLRRCHAKSEVKRVKRTPE